MKSFHVVVVTVAAIALGILGSPNNAYAPCPMGVTSCGPPPGDNVDTWTDSPFYERNDTILLRGHVNVSNYTGPMVVRLVDPQEKTIQNFSAPVSGNRTFSLKIPADFGKTGQYQLVTCLKGWCGRSWFNYIAEPYNLSFDNRTFLIKYKTYADLAGIDVDIGRKALVVHVANATSTGQRLVMQLPRQLMDPKMGSHDAPFKVLVGQIQAEKYMAIADFKEIAATNESRTLSIDIPYAPTTDAAGIWDIEIKGPEIPSGPSFFMASPLKQFQYGMYAKGVHCQDDLLLILRAEDGSPACVTANTAQGLMERGWTREAATPNVGVDSSCNGTEILSPNYHAMMFPVLLMQPNSVSCVKLTYDVNRPYGTDENGGSWPRYETIPLEVNDLNYEGDSYQYGVTMGKDYASSFNITAFPKTVDHANYPVGSNFTVTYLIRALPNSTGFYDQSVPMPPCDRYPLAVGYNAGQVNSSDFSKGLVTMMNHSCFNGQDSLVGVKVMGMSYTEMRLK